MDVNRVAELSVDFNEFVELKREGRVLLNPIGTLPKYSQQNVDLGLPIAIMDYQYDLVEEHRRAKGGESQSSGQRQQSLDISPSRCVYPENFPERDDIYKLVYRDLVVNYGYYVQQGSKYGCDFVLYENDPDTCHSSYLLNVVDSRSGCSGLSVKDLVMWQRVSNKVNKKAVIAVLSGREGVSEEVGYLILDNYDGERKVVR